MNTSIVHIEWEGPYSFVEITNYDNANDIGIYQVYGNHILYGKNVLLYIGSTVKQTFFQRISQEGWDIGDNISQYKFRLGRLKKDSSRKHSKIEDDIKLIEKLLIYAIRPALNTSNTISIDDDKLKKILVLNWKEIGDLPAEISGLKWTDLYWVQKKYMEYRT